MHRYFHEEKIYFKFIKEFIFKMASTLWYILYIIKINRFLSFIKFVWNKKFVFISEYYIYIVFKNFWKEKRLGD